MSIESITVAGSVSGAQPPPTFASLQTQQNVATNVYSVNGKRKNAYWRNQPQFNAVSSGSLIFLSAGMNLAQSLNWNQFAVEATKYFHLSWFIGVIIGCLVATLLILNISKKHILLFSCIFILIDGIIYVCIPESYNGIITARYINGIGIGAAWPIFLLYASEIAVNSYRGICLALDQYSLTFGISIQIIYSVVWSNMNFKVNCLHGIIDIFIAILAALCTHFWYIESPIYHLQQGDEMAALNCLACLEQPRGITNATRVLLEEHKLYVKEMYNDKNSFIRALLPLSKLLLLRSLMLAFSFALPLNIAIQLSTSLSLNNANWPLILYAVLRVIGALMVMCTIDCLGRKFISIFSIVILGCLYIALGVLLGSTINLLDEHKMAIACTLSLLSQLFAGLFTPNTSAYMGEAFPLKVKIYFLAVCVITEQITHILLICTLQSNSTRSLFIYFLTAGIISLLLFPILYITIPETRKVSLIEAQHRFHNLLNLKLY